MKIVLGIAWAFWGLAVVSFLAKRLARTLAYSNAFLRVVRKTSGVRNLHELRILKNRGDWRDPIERHHDSMADISSAASLAVLGLALTFFNCLIA